MPEFQSDFPSVVLWIEFHQLAQSSLRLTAVGCECGAFFLYKVDTRTNKILDTFSANHGTSITSCRFFTSHLGDNSFEGEAVHLLVTSALMPAVVYR